METHLSLPALFKYAIFHNYGGYFYLALQEFIICPAEGTTSPNKENMGNFWKNLHVLRFEEGSHSFKMQNSFDLKEIIFQIIDEIGLTLEYTVICSN